MSSNGNGLSYPPAGSFLLHVLRQEAHEDATIGKLFIDGHFMWYTLEDRLRPGQPKIPGQTAIPAGLYQVLFTFSNRFQRTMLQLMNVPGFSGIRIHAGNSAADTAGCILVGGGYTPGSNIISHSVVALEGVEAAVRAAMNAGRAVWCEVVDPPRGGAALTQ